MFRTVERANLKYASKFQFRYLFPISFRSFIYYLFYDSPGDPKELRFYFFGYQAPNTSRSDSTISLRIRNDFLE